MKDRKNEEVGTSGEAGADFYFECGDFSICGFSAEMRNTDELAPVR